MHSFTFAYLRTLAEMLDEQVNDIEEALDGTPVERHLVPIYVGPVPQPISLVRNPAHWEDQPMGGPLMLDEIRKTILGVHRLLDNVPQSDGDQ